MSNLSKCRPHNCYNTSSCWKYNLNTYQVVNFAVLVLLPTVSAILFKYWYKYQRYFSYTVSKWLLAKLFYLFLAILNTNIFVATFVVRCTS